MSFRQTSMVTTMARSRRLGALHVDPGAGTSAHALAAAVVAEVAAGRLGRGDPLPSTRALAEQLGASRALVVTAYDELAAGGFIRVIPGSGAVVDVSPTVAAAATTGTAQVPRSMRRPVSVAPAEPPRPAPARVRHNLVAGAPDVALISERDWRQAWRAASATVPELDWYQAMHHPELASTLVDHLRRTRGIVIDDPDDVIVFPGVSAAIEAVTAAWRPERAAMEDPGYPAARDPLLRSVARLDYIPVDDQGIRVDRLGRQGLVYVTPAHQFPLGGRMSVQRRDALLRWAQERDAVVVEDDFDGEFRHDTAPLGPLRSMRGGADRVVYIGTASKILTPHLRLAWAVVPPWLSEAVRAAGARHRTDASRVSSRALAHLMSSGALVRHLARTQRTYAARRKRLVAALEELAPHLDVVGVEAGIHVAVRWPSGPADTQVAAECAARGVAVGPLSRYAVEASVNGLLLGYAQLPETAARAAVAEIVAAYDLVAGAS